MVTIVIPMAGLGGRFQAAGYDVPKPLIPIHGIPMIEVVINNLRPRRPHRFVLICQRVHDRQYQLGRVLAELAPNSEMICIDGLTEGAACTVLKARALINNHQPLMIANCDQWIDCPIDDYLLAFDRSGCDGFIMTMKSDSPKWSFVKRDDHGRVVAVIEKQVVSPEATVGIYNFLCGRDFVTAAEAMINADIRVNNEFYVAPVFTQLVAGGCRIETFNIGTEGDGMYGLGTPVDLEAFLSRGLASRLAAERAHQCSAA